jgi:hypothetical protein
MQLQKCYMNVLHPSAKSSHAACCFYCYLDGDSFLRLGSEREACMQLLQKCYNMAERGTPLAIKSAVCLDHLKGFFYVEAFRDSHVSSSSSSSGSSACNAVSPHHMFPGACHYPCATPAQHLERGAKAETQCYLTCSCPAATPRSWRLCMGYLKHHLPQHCSHVGSRMHFLLLVFTCIGAVR